MKPRPCIPGCTACCGVIPWSIDEWKAVENHPGLFGVETIALIPGKSVIPARDGKPLTKCPFATSAGCSVHDKRPAICRLYGNVDRMRCPKDGGYRPERMMSDREAREALGITGRELA